MRCARLGGDKRAREEQQPANKPDGTDHANRVDHMTQHKIRKKKKEEEVNVEVEGWPV